MDLAAAATGPFESTTLHARLARLAGRWAGTAKTFVDPNDHAAFESAPVAGAIEMVLGGRFLRCAYASQLMGQPLAGELTLAYESGDRVWRTSWIDSMHTNGAIMISQSSPVAASSTADAVSADHVSSHVISVFGTYFVGEGLPRWGWRTELDDRTEGTLRIRMYNVEPEREESLGVDLELRAQR